MRTFLVGSDLVCFAASVAREDSGSRGRRSFLAPILALVAASLTTSARGQVVTEFPTPTAGSGPASIAKGYDGNLWFVEEQGNKVARVEVGAVITEFPIPTADSAPKVIVAGPDGNLWFTEVQGNQIGRITTAGVVTEFPVPTAGSQPAGIAAGPDGSLWFTEFQGNQIGRITTAGAVTEFPVPTTDSQPIGITAGPDGNLWFAELQGNNIGRITTAGVVTEFPVPTADSEPVFVVTGPDRNLWFTEGNGNQIGRMTTAGAVTEFPVPTASSYPTTIAADSEDLWFTESDGDQIGRITTGGVITEVPVLTAGSGLFGLVSRGRFVWFTESVTSKIGRMTKGPLFASPMSVDAHAVTGSNSNANGVLEPGETVEVDPSWANTLNTPQSFTGAASSLAGPAGPTYLIDDGAADYGTVTAGVQSDCDGATGDCYLMTISGARSVAHWDATFTESLSADSVSRSWTLHLGESFPDVPTTNLFYGFIENLFHNGITGGCAGGNYCPTNSVTRAQMAVFLMKSNLGPAEVPPPASGTVFADVPASNPFAPWIEQLAGFQITGGCGGGNYCPDSSVTRAQMAVFLLKSRYGSSYVPPACTGIFTDVACPSPFADWIEELSSEGITGGCGGTNYCPSSPNTRGQMAVFLVKTFGFQLYGP